MTIKERYSVTKPAVERLGYFLTLPSGFDASKESLPMIVFLHGSGEAGEDIDKIRVHGIPKLFGADPDYKGLRVITLSPQCPDGVIWNNIALEVWELIENVAGRYSVDLSRITLTGLSMGGYGTWEIGMLFHDRLAGIAPICGGGTEWRAGLLRDTPVWAFHGEADDCVPVENTKRMIASLEAAGGKPRATYYPGVGHGSWVPAYEQSELIEWLAARKIEK